MSLRSKLYERCPNETTVFLGPWEVINTEPRRVVWQCSYAGEVLEHFGHLISTFAAVVRFRSRMMTLKAQEVTHHPTYIMTSLLENLETDCEMTVLPQPKAPGMATVPP